MGEHEENIMERIMKREKEIRRDRLRKQIVALGASLSAMFIVVIGYIVLLPQNTGDTPALLQGYATALAASGKGGYVLIAVLAFIMGVIITMLSIKVKKYMDESEYD